MQRMHYQSEMELLSSFNGYLLQKTMPGVMGGIIVMVVMIQTGDIGMKDEADLMCGMMYMMRKRCAPSPQHDLGCEHYQAESKCGR